MLRLSFLSLLFLAGVVFLSFNIPVVEGSVVCTGAQDIGPGGICIPNNTGLADKPAADILKGLMNWLLIILGFIGIIAFVISGMQYLLAAGSEDMVETAKRNMLYSIVGIVVALSGLVIIMAINQALRGSSAF